MNKVWLWLIIVGVLVAAGWLRFYKLGAVPVGIYWDEVAMLVDAKSVADTGLDMHGRPWYQVMYPSYGDYKLPIYIWLATFSVKLFGVTTWALRLPSALTGLATIGVGGVIAYYALIAKSKSNSRVALWAMLSTMIVLGFSPWSVMFSRTAFEGHVGQLLLATSIACIVVSLHRKGWLWLSPILGALATYAYFSVRFVWPIVFLATSLFVLSKKIAAHSQSKTGSRLKYLRMVGEEIGLPLVLFGLLLLPMMNSPLYKDSNRFRLGTDSVLKNETEIIQSNVYREIAGNTIIDRVVFHRWWLTLREFLQNVSDNTSPNFLFSTGDPNLRHGTGMVGLFVWPLLPFFVLGWWYLFSKHRGLMLVLAGWWLSALVPASVPEGTPHALRSLNALVPLSVVIGVGIGASFEQWWRTRAGRGANLSHTLTTLVKTAILGTLVLAYLEVTATFCNYYFKIYPTRSANDWQGSYQELALAIVKIREAHPVYIQPLDDKFYLWSMAFGPYTGRDFHSWTSVNYQFRAFDGITFSQFIGWESVLNGDTRVAVAGPWESVDRVVTEHKGRVVREEVILGADQQPRYKVVLMDKLP